MAEEQLELLEQREKKVSELQIGAVYSAAPFQQDMETWLQSRRSETPPDNGAYNSWSEEKELELLEMWMEAPCLYDSSCREFSNKIIKARKYEEMARCLKVSVTELKRHMMSLRTQYKRYEKMTPNESALKKRTLRQRWVLEHCQWLSPHIRQRDGASSTDIADMDENFGDEEGDAGNQGNWDGGNSSEPPPPKAARFATMKTNRLKAAKRRREEREEEELSIMRSLVKAIQAPQEALPEPERVRIEVQKQDDEDDDDVIFTRYILREMRQIKDRRQKAILKNKIQNVIFQAQMDMLQPDC